MLQGVAVPGSVHEAQALLAGGGRPAIIAGGTAIMPVLNYGTDAFDRLVSLRKAGLAAITIAGGKASLGATASLAAIEETEALAFLRPALDTIASPTIRNMATVGGNLFVKQPYGDFATCLIALGATATVVGPAGTRGEAVEVIVAAGVAAGEIVTAIELAMPAAGSFKFVKAARRAFNSGAIVTVAAVVSVADGKVADCRIALGGVARHAIRAISAEAALIGKPFDRAHVEKAAQAATADIDPADDAYASAWYRARVTPVHIRRALLGE